MYSLNLSLSYLIANQNQDKNFYYQQFNVLEDLANAIRQEREIKEKKCWKRQNLHYIEMNGSLPRNSKTFN